MLVEYAVVAVFIAFTVIQFLFVPGTKAGQPQMRRQSRLAHCAEEENANRAANRAQDTTRIRPDLTGKLPVVGVILIHPAVA